MENILDEKGMIHISEPHSGDSFEEIIEL